MAPGSLAAGTIVIASHNRGKIREIQDLLGPFGFDIRSAADLGLADPEETGETFAENAVLKAEAACRACRVPALADDSGLAVDALGGAPGIHSARWAGPERDFARAMRNIEEKLQPAAAPTADLRRARFVCVLALALPEAETETFAGTIEGTLVWPPKGEMGFGYDPVFLPDGHERTFGEMSAAEKHGWSPGGGTGLSHRARAFAAFAAACLPRVNA